jgi:hypothetical protein
MSLKKMPVINALSLKMPHQQITKSCVKKEKKEKQNKS